MAPSDLNLLLEIGFDKARAELAIKRAGARKIYLLLPLNI